MASMCVRLKIMTNNLLPQSDMLISVHCIYDDKVIFYETSVTFASGLYWKYKLNGYPILFYSILRRMNLTARRIFMHRRVAVKFASHFVLVLCSLTCETLCEGRRGDKTREKRKGRKGCRGGNKRLYVVLFISCRCKSPLFILMGNAFLLWPAINYILGVEGIVFITVQILCVGLMPIGHLRCSK